MNVKKSDLSNYDCGFSTVDELESRYEPLCPAEVEPFRPCGKKMRRRKNGVTVCPDHGEMH